MIHFCSLCEQPIFPGERFVHFFQFFKEYLCDRYFHNRDQDDCWQLFVQGGTA